MTTNPISRNIWAHVPICVSRKKIPYAYVSLIKYKMIPRANKSTKATDIHHQGIDA